MSKKPLKVGLDFDGVVAYNPFRVVRAPWAYFKRHILGVKKLTFFYPKNSWQRFVWKMLHESSMFPASGTDLLREKIERGEIEVCLVTGRYRFLDHLLFAWLKKYRLQKLFTTIYINEKNEQPHIFKERIIKKLKFDVYVEDNLDIVQYLAKRCKTRIFWIYNITDRFHPYPHKFPYLKKALEAL